MSQPSSLEDQLREMYGRVAYTHKAHEKMADEYVRKYQAIKKVEVVLAAISAGSMVIAVFGESKSGTIVGAVLSTILLGLMLYFREAALGEQAQKHSVVASKLWGERERLLSLLIDMNDGRSPDEVRVQRDIVNNSLEEIYKSAPRTDPRAYAEAQRALKLDEELFFSDDELDKLLPKQLRRSKS